MKKALSVTLAFIIFALSVIPCLSLNTVKANASEYDNRCGLGVSWYVDTASGVLNINGKGRTFEYKSGSAPWDKYAKSITGIGDYDILKKKEDSQCIRKEAGDFGKSTGKHSGCVDLGRKVQKEDINKPRGVAHEVMHALTGNNDINTVHA